MILFYGFTSNVAVGLIVVECFLDQRAEGGVLSTKGERV